MRNFRNCDMGNQIILHSKWWRHYYRLNIFLCSFCNRNWWKSSHNGGF